MLNVIYKEYKEFNGYYLIGSNGTINNRTKDLNTYIINSGYVAIKLCVGKVRKHKLIHRMVAEMFVPNPENKSEVNHIDGNKLNNNASNLEWVTSSENKRHAYGTGLRKPTPAIGVKTGKASKYNNVSFDKNRNKWIGSVRHNKQTHFQKRFDTEEEAALHVNWILDKLKLVDRPKNVVNN